MNNILKNIVIFSMDASDAYNGFYWKHNKVIDITQNILCIISIIWFLSKLMFLLVRLKMYKN